MMNDVDLLLELTNDRQDCPGRKRFTPSDWVKCCKVALARYKTVNAAHCVLTSMWTVKCEPTADGFLEYMLTPEKHGTMAGWVLTPEGGCEDIYQHRRVFR